MLTFPTISYQTLQVTLQCKGTATHAVQAKEKILYAFVRITECAQL